MSVQNISIDIMIPSSTHFAQIYIKFVTFSHIFKRNKFENKGFNICNRNSKKKQEVTEMFVSNWN
jgi:hypothetical protein